jgi:DNA-binding MarR family transcriptional regulator
VRQAELVHYLVLAAQREGTRRLTRELRAIGLTPSQSEVLHILGDHGPLSLTEVGELLVCESGTNPSRLVDRLVGAGLVERVVAANDRRRVTLSLTCTGRGLEAGVRMVQDGLYLDLDLASAGLDLGPVLELLRRLSAGSPAGDALENRIAAQARSGAPG